MYMSRWVYPTSNKILTNPFSNLMTTRTLDASACLTRALGPRGRVRYLTMRLLFTHVDTGSTDALRKYSDEYSRKTLSDLLEDEEEGEVTTSLPSERSRPQRKVSSESSPDSLLLYGSDRLRT
ncbi:hypothetical protein EVAR_83590_1 [Eumeta japonica]|uniref:Uncharacterized protein n=1 Tax=Eumeta variegata TaxID=151549 RepID=A0A4C1UNE1_EUMVA|nr:hypothetical protein EVAR_83590_1 [Eumeta japonica]